MLPAFVGFAGTHPDGASPFPMPALPERASLTSGVAREVAQVELGAVPKLELVQIRQ